MTKKTRVAIGIPHYGPQVAEWWCPLVAKVGLFPQMGLEFAGLFTSGVSSTDQNRNRIIQDFREKSDAEWLYWMDSDNVTPNGGINRLLATGKKLVSGLYYGKGQGHVPIAYVRKDGAYTTIEKVLKWERGEILPVDSAGMGAILTHRSVFDDIEKVFRMYQQEGGGVRLIHKDKIKTPPKERTSYKNDGWMIEGQLRTRMFPVEFKNYPFPFFASMYGQTEDMAFFKYAKEAGHQLYIDTSLEVGHTNTYEVTGRHFRETQRRDAIMKMRGEQ